MDDTIYRKDALATLKDTLVDEEWVYAKRAIEALPPAQSDQKKGKWIKKMRVNETEKYTSYDPEWYCSCCGTKYDSHVAKIINFCYVCGADMREKGGAE